MVFGSLGWIDDTKANESGGGFGGHLGSAYSDHTVTTGLLKLVGGVAVSIGAILVTDATDGLVELIRGAAIVALSANLLNLLDRAPARSTKVSFMWFVVLAASVFIWSDSPTAEQREWAAGSDVYKRQLPLGPATCLGCRRGWGGNRTSAFGTPGATYAG